MNVKLEALRVSVGETKIVGQISHSHTDINDDHPGEVWAALRFLIKGEQDIAALKRYLAEHQKILAMYFSERYIDTLAKPQDKAA